MGRGRTFAGRSRYGHDGQRDVEVSLIFQQPVGSGAKYYGLIDAISERQSDALNTLGMRSRKLAVRSNADAGRHLNLVDGGPDPAIDLSANRC